MQQSEMPSLPDNPDQPSDVGTSPKKESLLQMEPKDWIKIVIMPIIVVLLTALLGTFVGNILQSNSFRLNERFKVKIDRVMSSELEVRQISEKVDNDLGQLRRSEVDMLNDLASYPLQRQKIIANAQVEDTRAVFLEDIKLQAIKVDHLVDELKVMKSSEELDIAYKSLQDDLSSYVKFMSDQKRFESIYSRDLQSNKQLISQHVFDPSNLILKDLTALLNCHRQIIDDLIQD